MREPLGKPTVYSPFLLHTQTRIYTHIHAHTSISHPFFFLHRFIYISLLYSSLFTSVSPHSLALFFPSFPLSHIYIQAYLHTTVFFHWSPFENHLIRKACEAHMSTPHQRTHLLPSLFTPPTLLSLFDWILLVFLSDLSCVSPCSTWLITLRD